MEHRTMSESEFIKEAVELLKPLDNINLTFEAKRGTKTDQTATIAHAVKFTKKGVNPTNIIVDGIKQFVVEAQRCWRAWYKKTGKVEMNFAYEVNVKGEAKPLSEQGLKIAKGKSKEEVQTLIEALQNSIK